MNEQDPRCLKLKEQIRSTLEGIYESGFRHFICGMAIGCDTFFAEAVLALREIHGDVTLEAAIPCDNQDGKWNHRQKETYARLLKLCDVCTYVSHSYTPGCMMMRNQYMIDRSSLLLACFNGRSSGTMSTILYAERKGIRTIILDL
jgi:uncharacterized phage-like protein YoqJ